MEVRSVVGVRLAVGNSASGDSTLGSEDAVVVHAVVVLLGVGVLDGEEDESVVVVGSGGGGAGGRVGST